MNRWFLLATLCVLFALPGLYRMRRDMSASSREAARSAWESGDAAAAARAWRDLTVETTAPAELLFNRALAETAAGRSREARWLLERFAARATDSPGGGREAPPDRRERPDALRGFLLGNAAWTEALAAEVLSERPEAGMPEIDAALIAFARARDAWEAVRGPKADDRYLDDWPEARDNVALAQAKIDALEKRRLDAASKKTGAGNNDVEERRDQLEANGRTEEVEQDAPGPPPELRPEELQRLLERLARKEAEKRELRRAKRRAAHRAGERDW